MNILVILVPVSLILGAIWLVGFIWALKRDQYEDLEGDAARILFDESDDAPRNDRR